MSSKSFFLMAAALFAVAAAAGASQPYAPVVSVQYNISESLPEQLMTLITTPLEQSFYKLERVVQVNSSTSHGSVEIEIQFDGGTSEQDLTRVIRQIEQLNFSDRIHVISRAVLLRPPRLIHDATHLQP
ncbi:efflux RND transporter permease subunit [Janthinobacterium sp. LS2A]|uniref:efflux RND transporter permease subunit n=1 Tax=Janthinobacterium sp. LS2A TaxID=3118590 RepID=UPI002F9367CC